MKHVLGEGVHVWEFAWERHGDGTNCFGHFGKTKGWPARLGQAAPVGSGSEMSVSKCSSCPEQETKDHEQGLQMGHVCKSEKYAPSRGHAGLAGAREVPSPGKAQDLHHHHPGQI